MQDEDFTLHTFGMHLEMLLKDADVSALAALSLAEEALDALQRQGKGRAPAGAAAEHGAVALEHVAAFQARVRFRKALLKVGPMCRVQ